MGRLHIDASEPSSLNDIISSIQSIRAFALVVVRRLVTLIVQVYLVLQVSLPDHFRQDMFIASLILYFDIITMLIHESTLPSSSQQKPSSQSSDPHSQTDCGIPFSRIQLHL